MATKKQTKSKARVTKPKAKKAAAKTKSKKTAVKKSSKQKGVNLNMRPRSSYKSCWSWWRWNQRC